MAHNPARFGLVDVDREEAIRWATVDVPGGVSLGLIARAAGVDADTVRALNPSLRRGRTPPGHESWQVRIPPDALSRFAERWARIRPRSPVNRPRVLRFGETLGDLGREVGESEDDIRELNGIEDGERVGAGTTLLVPVTARRRAPSRDEEEPVIAVPDGPRDVPGRRRIFYRAVRGDDLPEIARFFEVDAEELRRWNHIDPDAELQPGMFLQLFVRPELDLSRALVLTPDDCRVLVVGSEEFFAYHEAQNGRVRVRYRVRSGDTLSEIAQRFHIPLSSLVRINQMGRRTVLHPDDELIVYAERQHVPAELLPDAVSGDALDPGGEATVERTGPDLGGDTSDTEADDASAADEAEADEATDEPDGGSAVEATNEGAGASEAATD